MDNNLKYEMIEGYLQECVNNDIYDEDKANMILEMAYDKYILESGNEILDDCKELAIGLAASVALVAATVGGTLLITKALKTKMNKILNLYAKVYDKEVINIKNFQKLGLSKIERTKYFPEFVERNERPGDATFYGFKYLYKNKVVMVSIGSRRYTTSYGDTGTAISDGPVQTAFKILDSSLKKNEEYYIAAMSLEYGCLHGDAINFIKNTKKCFKDEIKRLKQEEKKTKNNN